MSIASEVVALLEADAPLMAILTGGVYEFDDVGRNGLNEESQPDAYANGYLQPVALVYYRGENAWGGGHDTAAKFKTLRGMLEVLLYDDGDETRDALDSAAARIEALLDETYVDNVNLKQVDRMNDRDPNQNNNALFIDLIFQAVHARQLA